MKNSKKDINYLSTSGVSIHKKSREFFKNL